MSLSLVECLAGLKRDHAVDVGQPVVFVREARLILRGAGARQNGRGRRGGRFGVRAVRVTRDARCEKTCRRDGKQGKCCACAHQLTRTASMTRPQTRHVVSR